MGGLGWQCGGGAAVVRWWCGGDGGEGLREYAQHLEPFIIEVLRSAWHRLAHAGVQPSHTFDTFHPPSIVLIFHLSGRDQLWDKTMHGMPEDDSRKRCYVTLNLSDMRPAHWAALRTLLVSSSSPGMTASRCTHYRSVHGSMATGDDNRSAALAPGGAGIGSLI